MPASCEDLVYRIAVVYCVCYLGGVQCETPCWQYGTVTRNLRQVIIGACTQYQETINPDVFCETSFRNCTAVWEAFSGAYVGQPRCNVSPDRYSDFISLTSHPVPPNKSLFWENVYPIIDRYSNKGRRFTAIGDTLAGYIGNGPQWCSSDGRDGIEPPGTICPGYDPTPECPQSAQRGFWIAASKKFASHASGHVHIMLNASYTPVFAGDTYFAVYELPFLRKTHVTMATLLLLNENPKKHETKCEDDSLEALKTALENKNIKFDCIENRWDTVMTLCLDYPDVPVCKNIVATGDVAYGTSSTNNAISRHVQNINLTSFLSFICLLFLTHIL